MIHSMPELFELYEMRRFLPLPYEAAAEPRLRRAQDKLQGGGADWVRLPEEGAGLLRLHTLAESVRSQGRTLLVVEDGGLEPGVRGTAECLGGSLDHVRFLGGLPSPEELRRALELAAHEDTVLLHTGREDAPAVRLLQAALEERYGREAERYILGGGAADGGFGLLGAAGLLSMAAAGVDIGALLEGAAEMRERCRTASFENPAWKYAAVRRQLCRSGFSIELLCCWDASLRPLLAWAGGLFAAAEGKERKALFPAAVDYSREFRTLGQYIQEGPRLFFETVVRLDGEEEATPDLPRLREAVMDGTLLSHTEHGVPNLILRPGGRTAEALGGLIYFFQYTCGLSACLLDADPLARPGVEDCEARIGGLFRGPAVETGTPGPAERRPAAAGIL